MLFVEFPFPPTEPPPATHPGTIPICCGCVAGEPGTVMVVKCVAGLLLKNWGVKRSDRANPTRRVLTREGLKTWVSSALYAESGTESPLYAKFGALHTPA